MKFLHLGDLHLGKRVYGYSMLDDQRFALEQVVRMAAQHQADAVVIAGDIYDKTVPSGEAVSLFDWFFTQLCERNITVLAVSGNHDSGERLDFGKTLLSQQGMHLIGTFDGTVASVTLTDREQCRVQFHLLPWLRPMEWRETMQLEQGTQQCVMEAALARTQWEHGTRHVLVAHTFVTVGGAMPEQSDSEIVPVGGVDAVDAALFDAYDYVALGHIHRPQRLGRDSVRYCGSLLKYSFSEAGQEKSITVVELKEKGSVDLRTIPLKPLHDLRKIRGTYLEVTAKSFYENRDCEDYLQVTLTDEEDVPDGMAKLRTIYPNLMRLEYDNKRTRSNAEVRAAERVEEKSELELFQEFYELQNNQSMTEVQEQFVEELLRGMKE